jgi:site-specific DNA recombinase
MPFDHEKLEILDAEVRDVSSRLTKLYDALETGKLDLNDLAPRIKELKAKQDELLKTRVLLEADMTLHGVQHVDKNQVKLYCDDLRRLLSETDIVKSKTFLRSFVEKIVIDVDKCTIYYKLPVPVTWHESEDLVLPIVPLSGAGGVRTPYLRDANEDCRHSCQIMRLGLKILADRTLPTPFQRPHKPPPGDRSHKPSHEKGRDT